MKLSEKTSIFRRIFFAFLKCTINFQCFGKKNQPHSSIISEVVDSERCACLNASQGLFLKPFRSEPVNETQKLLGSAKKNFYPTFWYF